MVRTSARMIGNAQNETTKVGIIYAAAAAAAVKWHKMLNECWADTFIHSLTHPHRGSGEREKG